MRTLQYDVVVVGGGPAGLAAALKAREKAEKVAVLERNDELGGILNQCIHSGFGLHVFKEELTGPEYAQRFIDKIRDTDIDCFLETMVIDISPDRELVAMSPEGMMVFQAKAIVLAMGCRERTRSQIRIPGTRPAGVFTAGLAQRYMNMENFRPGSRVLILGSGDIGLIMARRLTLEGIKVVGVYEVMPYANGLLRNIKNCLDDFGIPLHLSTTVTKIIGQSRLQAVEVSAVDEKLKPIPGTEEIIPCDTLLLSVGLIPENELSKEAGVRLSPVTNGPEVDETLQTSVPGIFACGNVLHVHDLVDQVTQEAEDAGESAAAFSLAQDLPGREAPVEVCPEGLVRYTVPSLIHLPAQGPVKVKFRVGRPVDSGIIRVASGSKILFESKKAKKFVPSIMENVRIRPDMIGDAGSPVTVSVIERDQKEG
ncbi:MAG: FAD-dependent oxidoreductase [Eubacterium sp.]|nr:FAD-dependent oxidoreductase [Eubacterium sp.]